MNAKQLKNSILQYAMQGKLVTQNPKDEVAQKLFDDIKLEKKQLIQEKIIKNEKSQPPITEEEIPFDIPSSWKWVRLGDIAKKVNDGTHHTPTYTDSGVQFLSVKDMSSGKLDFSNTRFISKEEHQELYKRCNPEFGDVLLTKVGTTGIPILVDTKKEFSLFVSVALIKFNQDMIYNKFLTYALQSPIVYQQSQDGTRGVGNKNLVIKTIKEFILPIPPFEEQKRIVGKIEEYLEKVNLYQVKYSSLSNLKKNFPKSLEKSIVQYGMEGKLVKQNLNEESAQQLLKRIRFEKEKLIIGKINKKEKELLPITEDEVPFDIPSSWEWVRLGDLSFISSGSTPLKSNIEYYQNGTIPWITSSATGKPFVLESDSFITEKALQECSLRKQPPGTLIMAMYGQGKTRGQTTELMIEATTNQACASISLHFKDERHKQYIKFCLKRVYDDIREQAVGGAQPNLNLSKIKNILIPLPPLDEQDRISKKIQSLLAINSLLK